jgi:hypothetical protein
MYIGYYVLKLRLFVCVLALSIAGFTSADTVTCKGLYVNRVSIQGDRDDNMSFSNHLVLSFKDNTNAAKGCGGAPYAHLSLNHLVANHLHSQALAAKMANAEVSILVNTSKKISTLSNQLSVIGFE